MKKILLGLTTTPKSNWREKCKEIDKYEIKEVALFPTFLKLKERKELYNLLQKTKLKKIPHVHLRDDMEEWELDFFYKNYKTKLFNIHPNLEAEHFLKFKKYKDKIFVENLLLINKEFKLILKKCAGICIDFSHWEDDKILQYIKRYKDFHNIIKNNKIGCCHISVIKKTSENIKNYKTNKIIKTHSCHWLDNLNELDYMKKYIIYIPKYASIELENSFKEQLKAKKYLEEMIKKYA